MRCSSYLSQVKVFDSPVSLGRVTWDFTRYRRTASGEIVEAPNAPVELVLETRSGRDDDPFDYYVFDELGRALEVDRQTYEDSPTPNAAIE